MTRSFMSIDAATGEPFGHPIAVSTQADVATVCAAAAAAFEPYSATGHAARADFLDRIGREIEALGDALITMAMRESGLPRARLEGERGRTVAQLGLFAQVVREGGFVGIRVDPALPERQPLPRPELRLRKVPIGPVAVFGASNFPLAFSTAGGDTASALAAGCPVVVKGHPAHPATGALVAAAIARAAASCGMPEGVFGHLVGPGNDLGSALVDDPRIAAVGFTGSRAGGIALWRRAQARVVPIPVFAEMSSVNPVILCPAALAARGDALGTGFVQSLTMGAGQFCTNPGLVLAIAGPGLDAFETAAAAAIAAAPAQTMLTDAIHAQYDAGVATLAGGAAVETLARGPAGSGRLCGAAALFATDAAAISAEPHLTDEVFGATSLIVRCRDADALRTVIAGLEGQLTATLHLDEGDQVLAASLIPLLEGKAGRILANGWPTGVEVAATMVHGGPWPATSDARTTSVGSLAINRFLRPVCYQNLPAALLPAELRDGVVS
ncbi:MULTISPECIES: aldehyde dehydrogenase (NADP(+)) [unclassified Sphingomonas]|uniref:aldehyde dehydrogenase (NADP(+)) n=1 Tax=unclassified Sphingomonas TaxID=196159 RepID=UPI0008379492|nr:MULTISPECIES: aldehyde dehydrogenase (NADP(+)) [unclassified Sphingomonas]